MKKTVLATAVITLMASNAFAEDRTIGMSYSPTPSVLGESVQFTCKATGDWSSRLSKAEITVYDTSDDKLVSERSMTISGLSATYDYIIPANKAAGTWDYKCYLKDSRDHKETKTRQFFVVANSTAVEPPPVEPPPVVPPPVEPPPAGSISQHLAITQYDGPQTCIACHQVEAEDMLNSLHMQWKGATPELTNAPGQVLGKAAGGINTFCTYAPSSKGACYACHVRADGNAPHPPTVNDVDCLMCHSDTYQRTTVPDPAHPLTVTDIFGKVKTYIFGAQDALGNYTTVPDYTLMPAGTTMVSLAQNVHKPTRTSCLRCHAKAGGGDWTKRGDMGLSTKNPTVTEDVHMSPDAGGQNMTCTSCHVTTKHKIGGRGIDLRQSEAADPQCTTCHTTAPHDNADLNRHAQGQVGCQTCHIRTFGKGGATEMSRDWLKPVWNQAFCAGQGGYIGEEVKVANVKPEYRWFDGTSYVYNVGEIITKNADGTYTMAKANGKAFDGKSKIVPVKNHWSVMPLHSSGKIIPPVIMDMFMTGDFNKAVLAGIQEQGLTGTTYTMVRTNAEMLITHGVDPKSKAPACTECHDTNGKTVDGTKMLPFGKLGYHTWPAKVASCTLCHSAYTSTMTDMHTRHAANAGGSGKLLCASCHTGEPTGLVKPTSDLCNDCHGSETWSSSQSLHKKHVSNGYQCVKCHKF